MPLLLELFLTFAKIGAFTFGGGYAMLSLLDHTCVEEKKWLTNEEFSDLTVIAESTPGPIAINSATFVGYKVGGVLGSVFATLGMVIPSFVIIYIISLFFDEFLKFDIVNRAFKGIQAFIAFLILSAGVKFIKKTVKNLLSVIIFSVAFICLTVLSFFAVNFSSIYYIIIGAVLSILINSIITAVNKTKKGGEK
jgi:chromate transporter